jgi:hypothetical protein
MPFIPITPNFLETSIEISNKLHELDINSYLIFEHCYFEMENLYFNFEYIYLNMKVHISILKIIISILNSGFQLCKVLHEFDFFIPKNCYLNPQIVVCILRINI